MIGFAEAAGIDPKWLARPAIKPGHGNPEPVKVELISAMDSPENVAVCLNCVLLECRSGGPGCPLHGKKPAVKRRDCRGNTRRDCRGNGTK